ncbi:uncharacterized protein [Cherax quadricarinatus]|uniref:uncharacterized protein isoform X2 n=1 Tax=Cherax quadricarinatus TaxID=27406 RepID=UPI00387E9A66
MDTFYPLWSFSDLPDELLLRILSCDCITVFDLCRAAATCSRLNNIVETQNLWRLKLMHHWPKVWDQLPYKKKVTDWHDEVKQLMCFDRQVQKLVSSLSSRLYQNLRLASNVHLTSPVYNEVDALVLSTNYAPYYVLNALRKIVENGSQHPREPVQLEPQEQRQPVQPRPNWQRVLPASKSSHSVIREVACCESVFAVFY